MMKIEMLPISEIKEYEHNVRKNDKAVPAVADSIKAYGFKVPVIVDKDNVLIAGHTRIRAAKQIGMEEVPAVRADDLTEDQVKAFRLADNKTAELSEWDFARLEEELNEMDPDAILMKYFGRVDREDDEMTEYEAEIDLSGFEDEEFEYECQNCGFRFNA